LGIGFSTLCRCVQQDHDKDFMSGKGNCNDCRDLLQNPQG
jgi:hypothetical protein